MPTFQECLVQARKDYRAQRPGYRQPHYLFPFLVGIFLIIWITFYPTGFHGVGKVALVILAVLASIFVVVFVEGSEIRKMANKIYANAWCEKTGWLYFDELSVPAYCPLEAKEGKPEYHDGFEMPHKSGGITNMNLVIDRGRSKYKKPYVVSWVYMDLPLDKFHFSKREITENGLVDNFQSKFTDMQSVEFESAEFHKRFRLMVSDMTDPIMLHQVFSPQVLDGFVSGNLTLPGEIIYQGGALWHIVEDAQLRIERLDSDLHLFLTPLNEMNHLMARLFDKETDAIHKDFPG